MGWGGFLDKLLSVLPIQKRVERWRNQLDDLEHQRTMLVRGKADAKLAKKLADVDAWIACLRQLLKNHP